ncbi:head maturation protease, ClpP-related [Lactobacillus gigeriorum]|uniref:ATP-dependent Clp protease proteolytic subunit n=1 Tax=Lactobacillus gigeriorum DSM 23908 = CRBIP 24.85 TaxID=1423751 RepID=I7KNY1_9LACO|nr:ATP-dependent Clp protease, protease subunit [Lactobacillus gigeriorum DSM 23908 = CRBIP 24.85]
MQVPTVNIKGVISSDDNAEIYQWFGYTAVTPSSVADQLSEAGGEDVIVNIGSNGGDVFAGSEIYSALKEYPGKVDVHITSLAASAASFIAMAGDSVQISPTAQIMIHRSSTSASGNTDAMASAKQATDSIDTMLVNVFHKKTGIKCEALYDMLKAETWINAEQAVKQGFADKILFEDEEADVTDNVYNGVGLISLSRKQIKDIKQILHPKRVTDDVDKLTDKKSKTEQVKYKLGLLF